jgi:DNA-binding response OmpR family regulator
MIVIIDDRPLVAGGQLSCFEREGVAGAAVGAEEFAEWFGSVCDGDAAAIEGFLLGSSPHRKDTMVQIRSRSNIPVIGVIDGRSLHDMLDLFAAGADDVVAKPFHVREILARISAIKRRQLSVEESIEVNGIRVFFDGRDPVVGGSVLPLPRRERRILEYLMTRRSARLTKTQIFNRVYGIFNEDIHESVIESHISRLRKRLRQRLDFDPIESQRYLGYRLVGQGLHVESPTLSEEQFTSPAQATDASLVRELVSG